MGWRWRHPFESIWVSPEDPRGQDSVVWKMRQNLEHRHHMHALVLRHACEHALLEITSVCRGSYGSLVTCQCPETDVCAAFNPTLLEVIPAYGDPNGSHVTIKVVSDAFEGKRAVQRQQMVYKV